MKDWILIVCVMKACPLQTCMISLKKKEAKSHVRCRFRLEENEKLVLTPFEKNLDIWRQLWRVLERSDLVNIQMYFKYQLLFLLERNP